MKTYQFVDFSETLTFNSLIMSNKNRYAKYILSSIICHEGMTAKSGHYITKIRATNGEYYTLDDATVYKINHEQFYGSKPYILFYEKIESEENDLGIYEMPQNNTRTEHNIEADSERTEMRNADSAAGSTLTKDNYSHMFQKKILPKIIEDERSRLHTFISKDSILEENSNIAYFLSVNESTNSNIIRLFKEKKYLRKHFPEKENLDNEEVIINKKGERILIGLIIKEQISEIVKISRIKKVLNTFKETIAKQNIQEIGLSYDPEMMDIAQWNNFINEFRYIFKNEVLKMTFYNKIFKVPLPENRLQVVKETHGNMHGHKGIYKTHARLATEFFWSGMKDDVEKFVRSCIECQTKKHTRVKTKMPMVLTKGGNGASERLAIDICGLYLKQMKNRSPKNMN